MTRCRESLPFTHAIPQRGNGDCTIASLAMLLGVSYEDALTEAVAVSHRPHRRGLYIKHIIETAARLHATLTYRRSINYDEDEGVLVGSILDKRHRVGHAVMLRWGVIIDPAGEHANVPTIWEPDAYLVHKHAAFTGILSRSQSGGKA